MTFDPARVADPLYFAAGRLAPHSDHRWFASGAEAAAGESSYEQSLDGLWKFHYAKNPDLAVAGFQEPEYDCSPWDDIAVPGHIQLQGYDRPQYANVQYPWDGLEAVEPGGVPKRYNPVASYVKHFELDRPLAAGERLAVRFDGAESGVAVWLNGAFMGYGEDSFTPSEFDLTAALRPGRNKLAARVFRFTSGSWIEDQDFYRFSGLFRSVVLFRRPRAHAEDVRVSVRFPNGLTQAHLEVTARVYGPQDKVQAALEGVGNLTPDAVRPPSPAAPADGIVRLCAEIPAPRLWSPEDPHLYRLTVTVADGDGDVTEVIPLEVGVRRFGIEDGLLKLNGRRVVFNGVNRHEFGLRGRVVTAEETEADVRLMKAAGINAVRTSHYPNNSYLYGLCDRYGLMVIDEMNLESHGMWDRVRRAGLPVTEALPGDRPEWLPAVMDRAASMFERDKNHACVVMWSCGNESFGGLDILEVSRYFRGVDSRPVHYEGVHWDPRHPETTDVASRMYAPAAEVERYLETHRDKPFILCEYAHSMGNSFGGVGRYLDLAYREPLFQGGFVWDFADQAVPLTDRLGRGYFGYGGDSGEAPHDQDFSGNGVLFADHTPKPAMQELRHLYQPFSIRVSRDSFAVENRHLFTDAAAYACEVTLAREGVVLERRPVEVSLAPGARGEWPLPFALPGAPGEYAVDVSFRLREAAPWAPAGHEVAWQQAVFQVPAAKEGIQLDAAGAAAPSRKPALSRANDPSAARTPAPSAGRLAPDWVGPKAKRGPDPVLVDGVHNIGVRGEHFTVLFSRIFGGLTSYRYGLTPDGGRELFKSVPRPNFWHAPTSNEQGWGMPLRDGQWLLASRYGRLRDGPAGVDPGGRLGGNPSVQTGDGWVEVVYRLALGGLPPVECDLAYRVFGDGRVEVEATAWPGEGASDPPEFGVMFTVPPEMDRLRWYGEGPEECYVDRRGGARLGVYQADVASGLTPYLRPQESGNHTGVRWAEVADARGRGIRFECDARAAAPGAPGGMEFSALPWTPFEVENAAHPNELPAPRHTVIRPALMRRGVAGDDSWGAEPHPEFRLPTGKLTFRFTFQGLLS